jgi:hypothetical protein
MATIIPGMLVPWLPRQFRDDQGLPLVGGKLYSYIAGTTTPQPTYLNSDLAAGHENANPLILDAHGSTPNPIFLLPTGYKFNLTDANDVQVPDYPIDNVSDVGQVFANQIGVLYGTSRTVTNNQTQAAADRLIFVNSTAVNPTIFNLLAANLWGNLLVVKNIGTNPVKITPNGANTIEGVNAFYQIPAASGTTQPSVILASDGSAGIVILASHKVP